MYMDPTPLSDKWLENKHTTTTNNKRFHGTWRELTPHTPSTYYPC